MLTDLARFSQQLYFLNVQQHCFLVQPVSYANAVHFLYKNHLYCASNQILILILININIKAKLIDVHQTQVSHIIWKYVRSVRTTVTAEENANKVRAKKVTFFHFLLKLYS